jgi:predicted RNA-binding Zn-ribbon protein involved in translation (DUF1610 family)
LVVVKTKRREKMLPTPNYVWKCNNCGKEIMGCKEESQIQFTLTCPKCGAQMKGDFIIKKGPFPENPFKKELIS